MYMNNSVFLLLLSFSCLFFRPVLKHCVVSMPSQTLSLAKSQNQ